MTPPELPSASSAVEAQAPCRRPAAHRALTASAVVDDLQRRTRPWLRPTRTAHVRSGVACLTRVADRLDQHRLGQRLERGRAPRRRSGSVCEPEPDRPMDEREAFDLGGERRAGRPRRHGASGRCSAVRRSESAAWVSAAHRRRACAGQIPLPVERHRDAEQPLDHVIVDLTGEGRSAARAPSRAFELGGRPIATTVASAAALPRVHSS